MKLTTKYLNNLIDVHITAGLQIQHIVMHANHLKRFFDDEELKKDFKLNKNLSLFREGQAGWWKGFEIRFDIYLDKNLIYAEAMKDEKKCKD